MPPASARRPAAPGSEEVNACARSQGLHIICIGTRLPVGFARGGGYCERARERMWVEWDEGVDCFGVFFSLGL